MGKFRIKYNKSNFKEIILIRIEEIEDTLDPEHVINKLKEDIEKKYEFFDESVNIIEIEKIDE